MDTDVPLTPVVVDCVTFDRAPLGKRGYNEDQVDDFLDRVQATLSGKDTLTAAEVRSVIFDPAPFIRRGYHEDQVDDFLDLVVEELERRESTTGGPAPRQVAGAHYRPAAPAQRAVPPETPAERTSPMLFAQPPSMPAPMTQPLRREPANPGTPGAPPISSVSASTDSSAVAQSPAPSESPIRSDTSDPDHAVAAPQAPASASLPPVPANAAADGPESPAPVEQPLAVPKDAAADSPQPQASADVTSVEQPPAAPANATTEGPEPQASADPAPVEQPPAIPANATADGPTSPTASVALPPTAPANATADGPEHQADMPSVELPPSVAAALAEAVKVVEQFEPRDEKTPEPATDAWQDSGHLALPLPPAPPGERGYRPGDVERLSRLLATVLDSADAPDPAELANLKLTRTFFVGQGYHAGTVDALRDAWVTELTRRAR